MEQMNRRNLLLAGLALPLVGGLSACTTGGGFSLTEAIRRLLSLSSQQAFATLLQPGGFYDSQVARIALPQQFASSGGLLGQVLTSSAVRTQLQRSLNGFAEDGARRAAPVVTNAIQNMSITDALSIVRGGPTAATGALEGQIGTGVLSAMSPAVGDAIRLANNAVVSRAVQAVSGYDMGALANDVTTGAARGIWNAIGAEETKIRANPRATNDPLLMAVFALT